MADYENQARADYENAPSSIEEQETQAAPKVITTGGSTTKVGSWPRTTWSKRDKTLTVLLCLLLTILMAAAMFVNNWTLLMATSQISWDRTYYCVSYSHSYLQQYYSRCLVVQPGYVSTTVPYCLGPLNTTDEMIEKDSGIKEMDLSLTRKWIWSLFCMLVTPDFLSLCYYLWHIRVELKHNKEDRKHNKKEVPVPIDWKTIFTTTLGMGLVETLYVIGTCCFVFTLLPSLNIAYHGLLITTSFGLAPAFFDFLFLDVDDLLGSLIRMCCVTKKTGSNPTEANNSDSHTNVKHPQILKMAIVLGNTFPALLFMVTMCILASVGMFGDPFTVQPWSILVAILFRPLLFAVPFSNQTRTFQIIKRHRCISYIFVFAWKILMTFAFMLAFTYRYISPMDVLFENSSTIPHGLRHIPSTELDRFWVILGNIVSGLVMMFAMRAVAKSRKDVPINLIAFFVATPTLLTLLMVGCDSWSNNPCLFEHILPPHLTFACPRKYHGDMWTEQQFWIGVIAWMYQIVIARKTFFNNEKDALLPSNEIFFSPIYWAFGLEQSMLYNRMHCKEKEETSGKSSNAKMPAALLHVFAEMKTPSVMVHMLTSFIKLYFEESAYKRDDVPQNTKGETLEYKAHIYLPDGVHQMKNIKDSLVLACWSTVSNRGKDGLNEDIQQKMLDKMETVEEETPYGRRITVLISLAHNLKKEFYFHLMNDTLTRECRGSLVSSEKHNMAFFLESLINDLSREEAANQIYVLAVNSGIAFVPESVRVMYNIIKGQEYAMASGRVYPIGSGPIVWYQKFDYAKSYWLNKATESVLGSLMFFSTCFTMFRFDGIEELKYISNAYSKLGNSAWRLNMSNNGWHMWLCNRMMKHGKVMKLCTLANAYEIVPETVKDYFVAKYACVSAGILNTLFVITYCQKVWKHAVVSVVFYLYNMVDLLCSSLASAVIMILINTALAQVMGVNVWITFLINLIPFLVYGYVCIAKDPHVQIAVATVLCFVYVLLQTLTVIVITMNSASEGINSPTTILTLCCVSVPVFGAILHLTDFWNVFHIIIYILLLPTFHTLLGIFSAVNLHILPDSMKKMMYNVERAGQEKADLKQSRIDARWNARRIRQSLCCQQGSAMEEAFEKIHMELGEMRKELASKATGLPAHQEHSEDIEESPEQPHELRRVREEEWEAYRKIMNSMKNKIKAVDQVQLRQSVKGLRDMASFCSLLLNATVICVVFILHLNEEKVSICIWHGFVLSPVHMMVIILVLLPTTLKVIGMLIHQSDRMIQFLATTSCLGSDVPPHNKDIATILREVRKDIGINQPGANSNERESETDENVYENI